MFLDSKKTVNLRGKKETAKEYHDRVERERKEREKQKQRDRAAAKIQAFYRGHRAGWTKKNSERLLWDQQVSSAPTLSLLRAFTFFYRPLLDEEIRLPKMCEIVLNNVKQQDSPNNLCLLLAEPKSRDALRFHLKKLLNACVRALPNSVPEKQPVLFETLNFFTDGSHLSAVLPKLEEASLQQIRAFVTSLFRSLASPKSCLFANSRKSIEVALLAGKVDAASTTLNLCDRALRHLAFEESVVQPFIREICPITNLAASTLRPVVAHITLDCLKSASTVNNLLQSVQASPSLDLLQCLVSFSTEAADSRHEASFPSYLALLQVLFMQLLPAPLSLSTAGVTAKNRFPRLPSPLFAVVTSFITTRLAKLLSVALSRYPFKEASTSGTIPLGAMIHPALLSILTIAALIQQYALDSNPLAISPLDASFALPTSGAFLRPLWKAIAASSDLAAALRTPMADGLVTDLNQRVVPLYSTVLLFCTGYLRVLGTLDDQHFADSNDPFPLHTVKEIAYTCKTLLWQHIWSRSVDKPELHPPLAALAALVQELSDRNIRSTFLDKKLWCVREQDLQDLEAELPIRTQRAVAALRELPFVIPFRTRAALFRSWLKEDREAYQSDIVRHISVTIRRKYLFEDAYRALNRGGGYLKQVLRVEFVGEDGAHEVGHGAGLTKEFLHLIAKLGFNPDLGLFIPNWQHQLYPNPGSHLVSDNHLQMYEFLGRMLGKILYDETPVELPLAFFFLAKLLGRSHNVNDLTYLDPMFLRSLLQIRDYEDKTLDALSLTFSLDENQFGALRIVDLKPRGRDLPVTPENKLEYISLMAQYKLHIQIRDQCEAFMRGFFDIIDPNWIKIFSQPELHGLICGSGDQTTPIDVADLRRNTVYTNGYHDKHVTVQYFWEIVATLSPLQQRKLLAFVTGTSAVPILGFAQLEPKFCIQRAHTEANHEDDLPTSNTCMNLLKLTPFDNPVVMREKLIYAIENCVGFELS